MTFEIRDADDIDEEALDNYDGSIVNVTTNPSPTITTDATDQFSREIGRMLDAAIYRAIDDGYEYVHTVFSIDESDHTFVPTFEIVITNREELDGRSHRYYVAPFHHYHLRARTTAEVFERAAARAMVLDACDYVTIEDDQ